MPLRIAALAAATVLVGLSALFAIEPISSADSVPAATTSADAATYVVVEPPTYSDCPWATSPEA
ncbi:hypothetical protein KOI35_39870 [Actinoplanes bogorensis]|uniref:Uncharacterized protein n=1 Tax=Paractinoplanes bogorensis TaxID=1610840 RepID=A0ABS5Z1W1_9ACTN|nr:hypothetical protein [Actinoplanes bogorensis]MBU2669685.1 hypothetical protein [Actinoplanes bogorensis]